MEDFARVIDFIRELEKLKTVERANLILGGGRKENSAEHSWHTAMIAMAFRERFEESLGVDMDAVIQMLLIHDIVEIDAGDTFFYSKEVNSQKQREEAAADRLFSMLPDKACVRMKALFEEFEAMRTKESQLAKALDYFQPLLNYREVGIRYTEHDPVYYQHVIDKKTLIGEVDEQLWKLAVDIILECRDRGMYAKDENGL